jgi:uncharacterized protein (TIGR00661 family)
MKILYGVVGEGMGHAMRSRVVIRYLLDQGHTISVMASGRAVEFLTKHFGSVKRIHGLHMIYEEGQVSRSKTLWSNAVTGASGLPRNVAAYFEMLGNFEPDLVVSDFESWTYLYGRTHRLPIVSIDNMQIINRCKHDKAVLAGEKASFRFTRAFIKAKLPGCNHYVITTFFRPPVRKKRTTLVAPILRPEIVAAKRRSGDHLLVYQTGEGNQALETALSESGMECRIYGVRRGIEEDQVEGNLRYRPFSEDGFIDDLASARAVVSGGGFTLMGEAVFLRKPMLSVPLKGQFEQVLNARYLEAEGYGLAAPAIDSSTLRRFLDRLPELEDNLAGYTQDDNRELHTTLDGLLDRAEAGVL